MKKRLIIVLTCVTICFGVIIARLSIISTSQVYSVGKTSSNYSLTIDTKRGYILDTNLEPLVSETYDYIAAVPPTNESIQAVAKFLNKVQKERLLEGYVQAVKVDKDFKAQNILVFKVPKRYTPYSLAPHLIGYLDDQNNGISGVEKTFNSKLIGGSLKVQFKRDALGNILVGKEIEVDDSNYNTNSNIVLTIDKKIQLIAEQAAKKHIEKGAVVVLENKTGKIRAMVSLPDFDQNNISFYLDSQNSPFINRALCSYNLGSVFKLTVAAAALENNVFIDHYCKGYTGAGDVIFNCLKTHQKVDLQKAIGYSCNTYFIELGKKVGAVELYNMAKSFGFGFADELCEDIVSMSGTLPNLKTLQINPATLANFSFGQGELMATPLQTASMIQAIANSGRLIQPSLIEGEVNNNNEFTFKNSVQAPTVVINSQTASTICEDMIYTVKEGTGKNSAPLYGGAGGKTGSAQTGITDEKGEEIVQAWFGGFFPEKTKDYTVVVLTEDGVSGGESCAPVFKEIAEKVGAIVK